MTAAELIAKLQELPQDARVVVDGYEGGLVDVDYVTTVPILLNRNTADYYGPHEEWESYLGYKPDETAVYIPR